MFVIPVAFFLFHRAGADVCVLCEVLLPCDQRGITAIRSNETKEKKKFFSAVILILAEGTRHIGGGMSASFPHGPFAGPLLA